MTGRLSPDPTVICAHRAPNAKLMSMPNPLLEPSALPFHASPFDSIRDEDYQPAIEEGMRRHLTEIKAIAGERAAPTFDNTIAAIERSGELLHRAGKAFFCVVSANTNETLQKAHAEVAPKLSEHTDAIYMNSRLHRRVKEVYDCRAALGLTPEQRFLVERYQKDFIRAGAQLSDAGKSRLRALNTEEATLSTEFGERLLAATRAGAVVVDDVEELEGLSRDEIAAAAEAANQRGMAGKWVIALQNTTQQPAQASLARRALRERLFLASAMRASHGDANDTHTLIQRLAQIRAEQAELLGFPTYAAYSLDDMGAKTPENALDLLSRLAPAATAKATREAERMQEIIDGDGDGGRFRLQPWDWQFYAERVRKAQYDIDVAELRPYLELNGVLQNGVFFAANKLFGISFKERQDIPVWHVDVRVFEVFDEDGSALALWYCDYFARESKRGGAWNDTFVDQSALMGTRPVVYDVANFEHPAPGQPALLTFDDVTTMFHEFGHALHNMLSHVTYPYCSGAKTPNDFVEFPSQFNEHWALEPAVFANYARHHQTGEPMPQTLVDRIRAARTFNQGYATTEYLAAALLDLAWHQLPAGAPPQNVEQFEREALGKYGVDVPEVPPRYHTPYFAHIWSGDYAANYYAYMWSEVLDADAFDWFRENGGMTRANGRRYREMILSRGGSAEAGAMYRAFTGRDPKIEPLMEQRGLVAPVVAASRTADNA
jgi:peptidyl-dipeptidase Dcp